MEQIYNKFILYESMLSLFKFLNLYFTILFNDLHSVYLFIRARSKYYSANSY